MDLGYPFFLATVVEHMDFALQHIDVALYPVCLAVNLGRTFFLDDVSKFCRFAAFKMETRVTFGSRFPLFCAQIPMSKSDTRFMTEGRKRSCVNQIVVRHIMCVFVTSWI